MSMAPRQESTTTKEAEIREPRGRVLIVDDEEVIALTLREFLLEERYEVATAMSMPQALGLVASFEPDVVLCDIQLPGGDGLTLLDRSLKLRPETLFIMITAYATVENAVAAFQRGAHDYLMKPVMFDEALAKIDRLMRYRRLLLENQALRRQFHAREDLMTLVGSSPGMQSVKTLIRKVGPTRSTVLITGESGTGKELVARALHTCGSEPESVFLAINGAAIPHDLLENQLFGHVRVPSPAPTETTRGCSWPRDEGPCSSTRSASWASRPRPSCCVPSRTRRSCQSAPTGLSRSRPGW